MGNVFGMCRDRKPIDDVIVLLAGLDNAGKTKTVSLLSGVKTDSEAPTVGFQPAHLRFHGRNVRLHDVGGGDQFRDAWRHYYLDAHGLMFVVDSADRTRLRECARVLEEVLSHPHISGKPVLILANKQDLDGAMDDLDIVESLEIETIVNKYKCPTRVESYSAYVPPEKKKKLILDPGLKNGYEWLLNYIIHRYDEINRRVIKDVNEEIAREYNRKSGIEESFENPNYKFDPKSPHSKDGIIIVKEVSTAGNNGFLKNDNRIKLSPLFGSKNPTTESTGSPVELEARTQMRKLSPIDRTKLFTAQSQSNQSANEIFAKQIKESKSQENLAVSNDETEENCQSSNQSANETLAKQIKELKSQENLAISNDDETEETCQSSNQTANEIFAKQIKEFRSQENLAMSNENPPNKSRITEVSLAPVNVKTDIQKIKLPPIKNNQETFEEINLSSNHVNRPQSASSAVRLQLEKAEAAKNKRQFSLKGLGSNKTNPDDSTSLYIFDPNDNKEEKKKDDKF